MAFTYDTFLTNARKTGLLPSFSQKELDIAKISPEYGLAALSLKQDAAKAVTPEQKLLAAEARKQLDAAYNLPQEPQETVQTASSAVPATAGVPTGTAVSAAPVAPQSTPTVYQKALQEADNTYHEGFTYSPETDETFKKMRQQAILEADRAREDTLARISAGSGGVPSSWAITAAQQAGDYTLQGLNNAIPELKETAYQRFLKNLEMEEDQEQQKIANALNLYKTLGYATPEIAEILGIKTSNGGTSAITPGSTPTGGYTGGTGYNNGSVSDADIRKIQRSLSVTPDGKWGPESSKAAGGLTADEAWAKWGAELTDREDPVPPAYNYNQILVGAINGVRNGRSSAEIGNYLSSAVKEGYITNAQLALILKEIRNIQGLTG